MTSEAKKLARLRLLKRIGIIGLITSAAIGLVFLILSLLPQGNAAFSIRIDNPGTIENSNFSIFTSEDQAKEGNKKDSVTYLAGEPLKRAGQTDAKWVESQLSQLDSFNGGLHLKNNEDKELAMVYTIYLTNTTDEEVDIQYAVRLDAYKEAVEEMAAPIEYFRVLIQTEEVGTPNSVSNAYFGQRRTGRFPNYIYDSEDGREPIYTVSYEKDVQTHVKSDFFSNGNDGYCVNFSDYKITKDIVLSSVKIPVGKVLRYTFVAYFDGTDVDSYVRAQNDDYLLLSLHFGI